MRWCLARTHASAAAAAAAAAAVSCTAAGGSSSSRRLLACLPAHVASRVSSCNSRGGVVGCSGSSSIPRQLVLTAAGAPPVCLHAGVLPLGWRSGPSIGAAAAAGLSSGAGRMATTTAAAAAGGGEGTAACTDTGVLVVYVTAPSAEVAGSIAEQLVGARLAACVNILPGVTSVYSWKGKIEKDSEVLLIIKTQAVQLAALTAKVKELHPYDEPEVVGLPVVGGSASYLQWVADSTAATTEGSS